MEILDKAEHQRCFHYENEAPSTVEVRKFEKEHEEELVFHKNGVVFIMSGEVRLAFRDREEKLLRRNEFVFIPTGKVFQFKVLRKTQMIIIRPNGSVELCGGFLIEKLYRKGNTLLQNEQGDICTLTLNRPMKLFLDGLTEITQDGFNCRYYFDTKVKEMFILLKAYYPREQLHDFFASILSPDTIFSEHIRSNCHKYVTTKEMAWAMNMTPKNFSKKFISIFGELPTDWMRREKARRVYSELYTGQQPIAHIADKYNFSSQSHLNKFCMREFGKNPGKIRKEGVNI